MPLFTTGAKNSMLDALSIGFLSLHSAYSTSGAFEVVGGVPAYAQLAATFAAAAAGIKTLTGGPYNFDIPTAQEVDWIGLWSASHTFLGMTPNGGGVLQPFTTSGSTLSSPAHGFILNSALVVWAGAGAVLPVTLTEGVTYWVVTATIDTLQLATAPAGSPITFGSGAGFLQGILPTLSVAQSIFPVTVITLNANMAA